MSNRSARRKTHVVAAAALSALAVRPALPASLPALPPAYGVYYQTWEPAFYTGFAPRAQDPRRLHLHIGRGNQLRATLVLSEPVVSTYATDLVERQRTYRALADRGRVEPTQNGGLRAFEEALAMAGVERIAMSVAGATPAQAYEEGIELLSTLNPGRVFRQRIPVAALAERWVGRLRPGDGARMSNDRALELAADLLPTRIFVSSLGRGDRRALDTLVEASRAGAAAIHAPYVALLDRLSGGIYPERDGVLEFDELTAVYPVGTFNETTRYRGHEIPLYPTPGVWTLTTHQRSKTPDHVPTKLNYSYMPWLPYMHVGSDMHNSFHTPWWKMNTAATSFLPPSWRNVEGPDGTKLDHLWLVSRGPMSHGCTHVSPGHILELRQLLPATASAMARVAVYYNPSHLYDVFDIDGDLEPEVMGIGYYIAYSLRDKLPGTLRVAAERHAFHTWLYGDGVTYRDDGTAVLAEAEAARFVGRRAVAGAAYRNVRVYEQRYEPDKLQFYHLVSIPFAKELRRVGVAHPESAVTLRGLTGSEAPRGAISP